MTPGTVRASTRGGRSVLRSAAAVEAAALRSLTLGASLPLASLGNPLARLLDEALDLSGIDQVLGGSPDRTAVRRRAGAQPGGRATSGSPSAATPRPANIGSSTAAAGSRLGAGPAGGIGAAARAAATALQSAAGVGSSVGAALLPGTAAAGGSPRVAGRVTHQPPGAAPGRSAPPAGARQAAGPGRQPAAAPDLSPAQVRDSSSTVALRRAARASGRANGRANGRSAAPAAQAGPADAPSPARRGTPAGKSPDSGSTSASATSHTLPAGAAAAGAAGSATHAGVAGSAAAAARAAYPDLAAPGTAPQREFSGGGLAELVTRWQDGQPDTGAPPEASGSSAASHPAWTPLSSTSFDRERPLRLGDEERIELALEQILRREVERHGLEGGRS